MHPSTARRERLVSPLNLALMAGLFAIAFFILKPDADLTGTSSSTAGDVDQLQLAYLKAQKHAGKTSDAEVLRVIRGLLVAGRVVEAKNLLLDYPALDMDDALRFEIDMELAALESNVSLLNVLETLATTKRWHQAPLLERAVELSLRLPDPKTSIALYEAWADSLVPADVQFEGSRSEQVAAVYSQCGENLLTRGEKELAARCYQNAIDALPDSVSAVDLQLDLLPLLAEGGDEQQQLLQTLMQNEQLSTTQLSRKATVLLAVQKPELAYRIYARLALLEPASASRWLSEAARWAEAAGKSVDAAVFLDSLALQASDTNKVRLYEQVEKLLIQAGQGRAAFSRISSRIKQNPTDVALLERGVSLARQVGESRQALTWNTRLLSIAPDKQSALLLQSDLALAVGDLAEAQKAAARQVEANADDLAARRRLARVTEWNGKAQLALTHWQWLAEHGHGAPLEDRLTAMGEVVRLARLTLQPDIGAQALRELTLLEPASEQDITDLVTLYELNGQPELASIALRDIMALHGASEFALRTLAALEYRHLEYAASMDAWDQYVKLYGYSVEASLARMELLWRLDKKDKAMRVAGELEGKTLLARATDYQLRVMAEIAWRYRLPWLTLLVQPRIDTLDVEDQRTLHGRRSLSVLQASGDDDKAMRESIKLWRTTGDVDFALLAMQLAVKVDDRPVLDEFSPKQEKAQALHKTPGYWAQIASMRLREGDPDAARKAYERALKLDSDHVESVAGLLWLAIGEQDDALLQSLLQEHATLAERSPELWQAMAIGYLQLGASARSLVWFDRLLDQIEADYGMLLTYADALEYAGKASDARRVRQYALQQLRPLLLDGSASVEPLLLRQYTRLSTRYAGIESNEILIDYLLDPEGRTVEPGSDADDKAVEQLWREDMAISWLMSTQQYEHARLIMAQIHAKRLQAPAWQQLALALKDDDKAALESIVQAKGPLSVGNHILALRQLGNDKQAYALAQNALAPGAWLPRSGINDRQVAQDQYASLRDSRPSFIAGIVNGRRVDGLGVTDTGVEIRHSFANTRLGVSISALNRQLDSNRYDLDGMQQQDDLSLSLYYRGPSQYGRLTTGINSAEQGEYSYASGRYAIRDRNGRGELSAELAYNEAANYSPELVVAGAQNRATLGYDVNFGRREFARLRADATEISTRMEQSKVARGLGGSIEVGTRGSFGSNNWSTSVTASQLEHDRESELPAELRLAPDSTMNSVLAGEVQRLALGFSLSRGGVNADYPQVSSPRYYFNSSIGQNWPEQVVGIQIDAGAGIRVLGGDELSFSVSHDTQPIARSSSDATSLGLRYRYHFQ